MKFSRLAVVILVVVWGIVLLVPPLNLLLRAQLLGSDLIRFSAVVHSYDVPNYWEKAARRFPNEKSVLIQAAMEEPVPENSVDKDEAATGGEGEFDALAFRFPRLQPDLQPSSVFPGPFAADVYSEKVRRLDFLLKKYPDDIALIALQLKTMVRALQAERIGGELSDANLPEPVPQGYISPERKSKKSNFSTADLQRALELCARGQKLEPDNGFFDWIECFFLMHSWRDVAALQALEAAADKKHYEEYILNEVSIQQDAYSVIFNRPLLLEEKQAVLVNQLSTHVSSYRDMMRILSWESIKARRRGDHVLAMRIMVGQARAARRMRENAKTIYSELASGSMEDFAWASPAHGVKMKGTPEQRHKAREQVLRLYVTQHGQPELVAESASNYAAIQESREVITENSTRAFYGVPYWVLVLTHLHWKAGVVLLLLMISAVPLLILLGLGKQMLFMRRKLQIEKTALAEYPSKLEIGNGVLACSGLRAMSVLLVTVAVVGPGIGIWLYDAEQFKTLLEQNSYLYRLLRHSRPETFMDSMSSTHFWLWMMEHILSPWQIVLAVTPILFLTLYTAWRATEWQKRTAGEALQRFSLQRLLGYILTVFLAAAWISLAFFSGPEDFPFWYRTLTTVVLFCAGLLLLEKYLIWRNRPSRLAAVRYGLRLFGSSMMAWLVLCSVLYLILTVSSLPFRQFADAQTNRTMIMGELHAVKPGE